MTRYRVLPYRQGSRSAKALAEALGGKVLKLEGGTFKPKSDDVIIRWGHTGSTPSNLCDCWHEWFNSSSSFISSASNKLSFFKLMQQNNADIIPLFWTNKEDIPDDKFPIVCRTILSGHSGAGIVISNNRDDLVEAPLYVEYKKKKDEYRVHVGKVPAEIVTGTEGNPEKCVVIAVQRKAKRHDAVDVNWQVRNHKNGFVFVRNEVCPPAEVIESATKALVASGLDFGAVDVIWNEHEEKAYVLEINTAPGLEGQTVQDYANFFRQT